MHMADECGSERLSMRQARELVNVGAREGVYLASERVWGAARFVTCSCTYLSSFDGHSGACGNSPVVLSSGSSCS